MSEALKKQDPKTDEQKAEDIAYTINHAFACTVTDLASPYLSHKISTKIFHTHSSFRDWMIGEGVGDFVAVPVTVAIQNHAPRMVNGVRKVMETSFGWAFKKSARREARVWARENAVAADSKEAKDKEQEIYRYELEHLPQAAVWTATSMALNIATQKVAHKYMPAGHDHGHDHDEQPLWSMAYALLAESSLAPVWS